ncbi:MAG: Maf-like protein [Tannerellaceae bacterium]|nr:Maf-like protein [Tannerellaceae bacterium]MCD8176975.1 Maf-like protein [Tannerellaceae bacterium]
MLNNLNNYNIILGSNSPRRKELLAGLGLSFEVKPMPDIDESYPAGLRGEDIPLYIARNKAEAYLAELQPDDLLITADTIVWLNGKVLGKPQDHQDAIRILRSLSGNTHQVITGVCIVTSQKRIEFSVTSTVRFAMLGDDDILYYIENYQPFDKAGAYGIQEWIGYIGVESIQGSFYNVMGLPIQRVYTELKKL